MITISDRQTLTPGSGEVLPWQYGLFNTNIIPKIHPAKRARNPEGSASKHPLNRNTGNITPEPWLPAFKPVAFPS